MTLDAEIPEMRLLACIKEHFDADYYLNANLDVREARTEPLGHYILFGMPEGRAPNARMTGSEMQSLVAGALGMIPSHDELRAAYATHRESSSVLRRIKSVVRNKVLPSSAAAPRDNQPRRNAFALGKQPKKAFSLEDLIDLSAFNAFLLQGKPIPSKADAVEFLLAEGYRSLVPLNFHLVPDPQFHRSLYSGTKSLDDARLYKRWLETGYASGEFISEAHLLHTYGATSTKILHEFPHDAYRDAYSDLPDEWQSSQLLLHFLKAGIPEGRFLFDMPPPVLRLVIDVIVAIERVNPSQALDLSEKLLLLGHDSVRLRLIAIRQYKNLNRLWGAEKLLDGTESEVPIEKFWLSYHRGDVEKRLGKLPAARDYFEHAAAFEDDSVWVESEVENLLRSMFAQECQAASKWARNGRVEAALSKLDGAITNVYEAMKPYGWPEIPASAPAPSPPLHKRPLRIGFLADLFLPQCRLYRVDQKIEQMKAAGMHVELFDFREDSTQAFEQAGLFDAWLFYRVPAHFDVLKVVRIANDLGLPTIYEIDDFLIDPKHFPEPYESYDKSLSKDEYAGLQLTTAFNAGVAQLCEYGLASTPPLAQEMARYVRSGHTFTHRNALSSVHEKAVAAAARTDARNRSEDGNVRIFYGSGTKAHKDFLRSVFFDAVGEVLEKRPNVEFHSIGHVDAPKLTARFADRVVQKEPIWDVAAYWNELSSADINVAVLKKSLLTDCKSEIKWLEAAMLGIPSVVSGTSTMTGIVDDGETGMIARTKEEWVQKLLTLVDDAALRMTIGDKARKQAIENYSIEAMAQNIDGIFADVFKQPARTSAKAS